MSLPDITVRFDAEALAAHADTACNDLPGVMLAWGPTTVLLGSSPCCTFHTVPARRVAALRHGGAMAPATLSTQGAAARQRGGGPLRRTLLAQAIAGRPSTPEGGDIKSLCCAAAGIIPSPFQARAGFVYPTTSVRRGAEDAASLRFPLAPHAQPVEGYKHLRQAAHQVAGGDA